MSRSRKKTHVCNTSKTDGAYKRILNRRVRRKRLDDVPSGGAYRKMGESLLIRDGRHYCGSRSRMRWLGRPEMGGTPEEYARIYVRK